MGCHPTAALRRDAYSPFCPFPSSFILHPSSLSSSFLLSPTSFLLTQGSRDRIFRGSMLIHLLVLNYNGSRLLAECLPSVLEAARGSAPPLRRDGHRQRFQRRFARACWPSGFPRSAWCRRSNRGLCSFNDVVAELPGPVALLLNNDIKLRGDCIDPLVEPLLEPDGDSACFMTAPRCYQFDGSDLRRFQDRRGLAVWVGASHGIVPRLRHNSISRA